jgi:serine/threonine protein kinase
VAELSKYEFETLREDGALILCRGRSGEGQVEVLVLSSLGERPLPESMKRLENEYSLREELDPNWAAQPIRFAAHGDRTVLLLHDPGGVPLDHLLRAHSSRAAKEEASTQPLNIGLALRLAIRISAAIGALHRRGIIHKDIKPANVLVSPVTGQCWLTGFGIASRLPRERQPLAPPEFIAGTLPYMAPEQTGRMNRSIDSRSDLYALGVTLYEMLTGTLPFSATDPMEWVHCHIARQPLPPDQRSKAVPASVSAIVTKLLAKTAEERYQTAAGVESDLRRCLDEWEAASGSCRIRLRQSAAETTSFTEAMPDSAPAGRVLPSDQRNANDPAAVAPFPLGQHDTPDHLRIP